jgi:archaemetzincin
MFGIRHCIHFQCAMNGANNQAESDRTPLHLCPVCLRKLHHLLNFDVVTREEALANWYAEHKLTPEAEWSRKRLEKIR